VLNRATPPGFSTDFSFQLPSVENYSLTGGTSLVLFKGIQQEVFKLEAIFKAGKWYESKPGLAHLTGALLDKGTADKSAREIAEIFDYYGAQVEISSGYDFISVSLYALKKYFDKVLPLFWEMLSAPVFRGPEVDLQKEILIQNLKVNNEKNSYVAGKLLRKNIFGIGHPYGSAVEGEHIAGLTADDLRQFFATSFSPVEFYLAGNFDDPTIDALTHRLGNAAWPRPAEKHMVANPGVTREHQVKPDSVQSSLRLGKSVINRDHPDYFHLLLLNHILGGYFGSRLMKSIREEKGLTYGIYSSVSPFRNECMMSIGSDVNKDKVALTLDEIRKELSQLCEKAIPEEELVVSRNHFMGSLQLEVASPFSAFEKVKGIRLNGLDPQYYHRMVASLQAATSEDLLRTARNYISPESFYEVVVG